MNLKKEKRKIVVHTKLLKYVNKQYNIESVVLVEGGVTNVLRSNRLPKLLLATYIFNCSDQQYVCMHN